MGRLLDLLCPAQCAESVDSVDLSELGARGIRALLIDLDNTLVPWRGYEIRPRVMEWVSSLPDHGMKACIVSNTRHPSRLRQLAGELGIPYASRGMKPGSVGFREGMMILEADISETAVIGDQVFTDILGGNRLSLYTILVSPLQRKEFVGTKISRLFERIVLKTLSNRGMIEFSRQVSKYAGEQTGGSGRQN